MGVYNFIHFFNSWEVEKENYIFLMLYPLKRQGEGVWAISYFFVIWVRKRRRNLPFSQNNNLKEEEKEH